MHHQRQLNLVCSDHLLQNVCQKQICREAYSIQCSLQRALRGRPVMDRHSQSLTEITHSERQVSMYYPLGILGMRMYSQTYEVGGLQRSESMRSQGNTSAGSGYSSCAFPARYLFMRRCVEWLKPSDGTTLRCFVRHVCTVVRTCTTGHGPIRLPIESRDGRFGNHD